MRQGLSQQSRRCHRHVLSFLCRERAHVADDEIGFAQPELLPIPRRRLGHLYAGVDDLDLGGRHTTLDQPAADGVRDGDDAVAGPGIFQPVQPRIPGLERYVARDHAADPGSEREPERFPERDRQRPSAVSMNDVGGAQSEFRDRESIGLGSFGQYAGRRAHDGLPVSPRAQPPRQREQRFLSAAPGFFGVHVDDGKGSQKNKCSSFCRLAGSGRVVIKYALMIRLKWLGICVLLCAANAYSESKWIRMQSPNFVAYSSAGERDTRDTLRYFERVRDFFLQVNQREPPQARAGVRRGVRVREGIRALPVQ